MLKISVIIPVFHEEHNINITISNIYKFSENYPIEIIVVDSDPEESTLKVIDFSEVIKLKSPKGRAKQLNSGAKEAKGYILLFLHADTLLPLKSFSRINEILTEGRFLAGAFDLEINSRGLAYRLIEKVASIRSRITKIPYGDQALFFDKNYFFDLGAFKEIPIMEDVEIMQRVKKSGKEIFILPEKVITSARRWQKDGILYTTFRNWLLITMYFIGVAPEKLSKFYK